MHVLVNLRPIIVYENIKTSKSNLIRRLVYRSDK